MNALRILIIDDDDRLVKVLRDCFENEGHTVSDTANLWQAEQMIGQGKGDAYHVVFLDLDMSIADMPEEHQDYAVDTFAGWAFYKRVMPTDALRKKTIFLTAYDDQLAERLQSLDPPESPPGKKHVLAKGPNITEIALRMAGEIVRR